MPPFKSPDPPYPYQLASQIAAVDEWFTHRNVPVSTDGRLLLASWNIANLGAQKRSDKDLKLIAHIMQRFDLIAVQEVNDNYAPFARAVELMDGDFDWIINDTGGNRERLGFVYRRDKVTPGRLFAEVALRELDFPKRDIVVAYEKGGEQRIEVYYQLKFRPFDRNPFVGTFEAGNLDFTVANVHLYFGAFKNASSVEERAKYARRVMEIFALSDWAKKRRKSNKTYDRDIALIGDMNVPAGRHQDLRPARDYSRRSEGPRSRLQRLRLRQCHLQGQVEAVGAGASTEEGRLQVQRLRQASRLGPPSDLDGARH